MLRSSLHLALVVALATCSLPAVAASPGAVDPAALYEEGRRDFNQGFYKSAIEKFEASYKRSKDPLILYNIGLTYKKLYDEEPRTELLKSARTALKDYIAAVEKDPGLGADPDEVKPVLAEIDAELARVDKEPTPEGPSEPNESQPTTKAEDPGRKLKLAGIGLMASGGALVVVGSIVGGVFAVKSAGLGDKLNGEGGYYSQLMDVGGCTNEPTTGEPPACGPIHDSIADTRAKGSTANTASIVSFGVVGGLGALLVIGGAVSYVLGKKRTADDGSTARLRVLPTAGWNHGGLVFEGRF